MTLKLTKQLKRQAETFNLGFEWINYDGSGAGDNIDTVNISIGHPYADLTIILTDDIEVEHCSAQVDTPNGAEAGYMYIINTNPGGTSYYRLVNLLAGWDWDRLSRPSVDMRKIKLPAGTIINCKVTNMTDGVIARLTLLGRKLNQD